MISVTIELSCSEPNRIGTVTDWVNKLLQEVSSHNIVLHSVEVEEDDA